MHNVSVSQEQGNKKAVLPCPHTQLSCGSKAFESGNAVQITEAESQYVRRSDCDTLFIVANYQPDKKDPSVAVSDEHALMRFEFVEAVVRLAVAKYGKVCIPSHIPRVWVSEVVLLYYQW